MERKRFSSPRTGDVASPVQRGDIVDGKYLVGECIAWGGMGIVSSATHMHLQKEVALKCIRPEFTKNPEVVARFLNEARLAASLRSEHVARVLDFGTTQMGVAYLVMERLEGASLSAVLKQWGPLPVSEVVDYVLQACESLAEAHAAGIVHRDIKPENLFLTQGVDGRPIVKVLDFGISKQITGEVDRTLTNPGTSMGSPWYMSPEQMRNACDVDARSDIWSIGVVLFELLTERTPFSGNTLTAICSSVLCDATPSLRRIRPDIPIELEAVVRRCLEKDRAARFADVTEMAAALSPFASPAGRAIAPRVQGIAIASARPSDRRSSADSAASWVHPSDPGDADSRETRIAGERLNLMPMVAAILLVAMAVLGAAGSLGFDIVRPFQYALGAVGIEFTSQVDAPPLAREFELRFVPTVGPAQARPEPEAPTVFHRVSLASYAPAPSLPPPDDQPPPPSDAPIPAEP
jgi:eukaryotic-like serine/threonine-protein kinase